MRPLLFLFPFLTSFIISLGIIFLFIVLARYLPRGARRKGSRHIHKPNICRLGGAAVIVSFLVTIFLDHNLFISQSLWGIIIAAAFILVIGIWDDFWELSWKTQFFFQVAISMLVFITGTRITQVMNPFGGTVSFNGEQYFFLALFLVMAWMLVFINSMNWLDGIDGLSAGVTLIGALTIFAVSLLPEVNQPPVGIIAMALAGSVAGLLVFNFNPARILGGTTGSMFMGFILAVMAIFAGAKIATALLVMAAPLIDFLWVMGERFRAGKSIFQADRRHLHYKLMEIGWSQKKIAFFFYAITLSVAFIALNTRAMGKFVALGMVTVLMLATLIFVNQKIRVMKGQDAKN